MSQYEQVPFDGNYNTDFVQASDPVALQTVLQAQIAAEIAANRRVVGMDLAGAGDGATFTVRVDADAAGTPVAGMVAYCFEADNYQALGLAFEAVKTAHLADGLVALDQMIAGANSGKRCMGVLVLVPAGAYPNLVTNGGAGFGFPIGAANTPLLMTAGHTISADGTAAGVPFVLDAASNASLFALGSGADGGKLKYIGLAPMVAEVTLDLVISDAGAPNNVTAALLKNGASQATTIQTTAAATDSSMGLTALLNLAPGDLLDVSIDAAVSVVKYHLTAARA